MSKSKKRIKKTDIVKEDLDFLLTELCLSKVKVAKIMECSSDFIMACIKFYNIDMPFISDIIKNQYKNGRKVNCKIYDIASKEDIEFLYNEKQMSLNKMKDIFDTSIPTLKKWMQKYDIKVRGISSSLKILHESGYKNHFYLRSFQRTLIKYRKKYNRSTAEIEIFNFIKDNYDGKMFNSYYIENKNFDIYLPELKIAIEYNGLYWHSEEKNKNKNYHKEKTEICNENGIRLIHIWEDDWKFNNKRVKMWLLGIIRISKPKKIFARKTKAILIPPHEAKILFDTYHIQGFVNSSKCIALFYDDQLISACLFKIDKDKWNLTRYVTNFDYQIIGGFSKLVKNFRKKYKGIIYTFADLTWVSSIDNVYLRNNFKEDKKIPPDYKYIIDKKRYHKFGFRHKQLKNKLKLYDPLLTEYQNCLNNDIYRIWDCGKIKYKY